MSKRARELGKKSNRGAPNLNAHFIQHIFFKYRECIEFVLVDIQSMVLPLELDLLHRYRVGAADI